MKLLLKRLAIGGVAVFAIAQLIRPDLTNPKSDPNSSITKDRAVPPPILAQISRSCFDCHSNETRWPWYSVITPVNFLVTRDVKNGRSQMNLSDWLALKPGRRISHLEHMYDEIADGAMPLQPYLLMHPEARWSAEEKKAFLEWSAALQDSLAALPE